MGNCVMLLGKSGTGKSTSIKGLDPKETVVLNVLNKRLPFKGSGGAYNKESLNLFHINTYTDCINMLKDIDSKAPHVKNIIIDDSVYLMRKEFFSRAKENGYNKFTEIAMHFQQIITTCESMKADINIFLVLHSEDVVSDNTIAEYKVSTVGKLLDSSYNPIEVVPMVLYSDVKYDDKGNASYGFYTHRFMKNQTVIPAKTPDGMFDSDFIPNDLGLVVTAMKEYYG